MRALACRALTPARREWTISRAPTISLINLDYELTSSCVDQFLAAMQEGEEISTMMEEEEDADAAYAADVESDESDRESRLARQLVRKAVCKFVDSEFIFGLAHLLDQQILLIKYGRSEKVIVEYFGLRMELRRDENGKTFEIEMV
jgi:hypothetical protein